LKLVKTTIISALVVSFQFGTHDGFAQEEPGFEKQLWAGAYFNFRVNDRWVYNQDMAYQHSYETPTFTRLSLRSMISRQVTGAVSLHAGLNFLYKFNEMDNNALEIRPWLGTKLRWPYLWRFNFVHYLRFEQRFEHTMKVNDWENNFRVRYKIGSNVPINHESIVDKTIYGVFAYEFLSVSFGDDIRFTTAATHRFDLGFGYKQNIKNRYEALLVALNGLSVDNGHYTLSSAVLFLKYKRYINWE